MLVQSQTWPEVITSFLADNSIIPERFRHAELDCSILPIEHSDPDDPETKIVEGGFRVRLGPNAKSYPLFSLREFAGRIGFSGFNYHQQVAEFLVAESDFGHGSNAQTAEQLDEIVEASRGLIEVRRSTGGKGFHYRLELAEPVPCHSRADYNALCRYGFAETGKRCGINFLERTCKQGDILWTWGNNQATNAFELVSAQTIPFAVADDWKPPVTRVRIASERVVAITAEHQKVLDYLYEHGWVVENGILDGSEFYKIHTRGLADAHAALGLAGIFNTISPGTDPSGANGYMFPRDGGGWQVFVYGRDEPGWNKRQSDGKCWCWFNTFDPKEDWSTLTNHFRGVLKDHIRQSTVVYPSFAVAAEVILRCGGKLPIPVDLSDREITLTIKDNCIQCQTARHKDEVTPIGWIQQTERRFGCSVELQPKQIDRAEYEAVQTDSELPRIQITYDEENVADQAVATLATIPGIYTRGTALSRVVQGATPPEGVARVADAPLIELLPTPTLREKLASSAVYWSMSPDGPSQAHIPAWVTNSVHERTTYPCPPIVGIVGTPFLRKDGSIASAAGYDPLTGVYCDFAFELPKLPSTDEAVRNLLDVITDFPFVGDEHRSVWVSSVLTPLARYAHPDPAPLHHFDASTPGMGKSLVADASGLITTGRPLARLAMPRNEEEWQKKITSMAFAGDSVILLDNIDQIVNSAVFNAALTATTWTDRVLGVSKMVTLPLNMTWLSGGNNVSFGRETTRRAVYSRMECLEERPEERTGFKHEHLLAHIKTNRPILVASALAILNRYCEAGRPNQNLPPWGSFDTWSDLVRGAIVWAGMDDPGKTRLAMAEKADDELELMRRLFACWYELDPKGVGYSVADAIQKINEPAAEYALLDFIREMPGVGRPEHRLGQVLKRYKDRVVSGVVMRKLDHWAGAKWCVKPIFGSDDNDT